MISGKSYPNLAVNTEELLTTANSTLTLAAATTAQCDAILIIPTGGNCYVAFRQATPATTNLKVPDGDNLFLQLSEQEANGLRLRIDAGQVRVISFKQK